MAKRAQGFMNPLGLTPKELALIRSVLEQWPQITRLRIFGSRAQGTHRPNSDIDLCVEGLPDALDAQRLASQLEELPLPYKFDVVHFESLEPGALKDQIETKAQTL